MPIHMDILPIERLVVIVARGHVTAEEMAENTKKLIIANAPTYAKIIDVTGSNSDLTRERVEWVAAMLRGRSHFQDAGALWPSSLIPGAEGLPRRSPG